MKFDNIESQFICPDGCDAYDYAYSYFLKVKEQTNFYSYKFEDRRVDFPFNHGRCGEIDASDNKILCLLGDGHLLAIAYLSRTDMNNWQCNLSDCNFIESF